MHKTTTATTKNSHHGLPLLAIVLEIHINFMYKLKQMRKFVRVLGMRNSVCEKKEMHLQKCLETA